MKVRTVLLLVLLAMILLVVPLPGFAPIPAARSLVRQGEIATGDTFFSMNQSDLSLMFYNDALATNSSDSLLLEKKGKALIRSGRDREAEQVYGQVLTTDSNDTMALEYMGDSLAGQGNLTGGIAYYDRALAFSPDNAGLWMREGDVYLLMSVNEDQELHAAARNLSKQPGTPGYQMGSSQEIRGMTSYRKSVESYQKAIELDPRLSVIVSTRLLAATESQVSDYQDLLNDIHPAATLPADSPTASLPASTLA